MKKAVTFPNVHSLFNIVMQPHNRTLFLCVAGIVFRQRAPKLCQLVVLGAQREYHRQRDGEDYCLSHVFVWFEFPSKR